MKRLLAVLFLAVFLLPTRAFGIDLTTGRVTQSEVIFSGRDTQYIDFYCTGQIHDGSIPNTATNAHNTSKIQGWYLYSAEAFPTSGGVPPSVSNLFIWDEEDLDLLGSEDGGTTAWAGSLLVHPTLKRKTLPNIMLPRADLHVNHYHLVRGALTIDVDGQSTTSANWTIRLHFVR